MAEGHSGREGGNCQEKKTDTAIQKEKRSRVLAKEIGGSIWTMGRLYSFVSIEGGVKNFLAR